MLASPGWRAKQTQRNRPFKAAVALIEIRLEPAAELLFGSRATGHSRPDSDFGLGVVLQGREGRSALDVAALKTELEDRPGFDVDLVLLDQASPSLWMEALRSHRLLRERDSEVLEEFTVRTFMEYADLKQIRAPIERALLGGSVR